MTVRVLEGHVLAALRSLPANTFQCVATSPPYYGLRDYGLPPQVWGGEPEHEHEWEPLPPRTPWVARPDHNNGVFTGTRGVHASSAEVSKERAAGAFCACGAWLGSLGLEPTPELYVEHLVSVFREVRRVLRPDGCIFVNLGDSYAGSGKGPTGRNGIGDQAERQGFTGGGCASWADRSLTPSGVGVTPSGYKPKDLLGMPWMVAFALRADGWYLRAEIIWSKPNPMPESVADRPTKAHETVFLLSKQRTYFYDADAVREPAIRAGEVVTLGGSKGRAFDPPPSDPNYRNGYAPWGRTIEVAAGRNNRSVWEIATAPFPNAHFATWPPKLVEPMLLAGTSEKGCCPECGAPWERVLVAKTHQTWHNHEDDLGNGQRQESNKFKGANYYANYTAPETTGWRPTCNCRAVTCPSCVVVELPHDGEESSTQERDSEGLRDLPAELLRSEDEQPVLQSCVQGSMACEDSQQQSRLDDIEQGIQVDLFAHSPVSEQGRVRDGTPIGDRIASGPAASAQRGCPSPERQQTRQPTGEPTGDGQADARFAARADVSGALSSLPTRVPGARQCPRCGTRLIEQPLTPVPQKVLDPFGGAGTTGLVADRLGRDCTLIELNPEYAQMARDRITGDSPLFAEVVA